MAFKMSPIGRNKDPYASMAKRGYIAPMKQNKTDEEMQNNASLDAENNMASTGEPKVTYSDPVVTYGEDEKGKYKQTDRDKTTTETFKGKGTDKDAWNENRKGVQGRYSSFEEFAKDAQAYRDKMTKTVDHESNKEYLPNTDDSSNKKSNELPHKLRADEMTKERKITGYKENPKYDIRYSSKYNEEQGNGPRKLPIYEDIQAIKGLNSEEIKDKTNSGDQNITVNSLTPDYDRLSESSTKDIQDDLKQNPDNNKTELSDDYSVLEKEYNEKNSPAKKMSATRQLMNKHMPKRSMARQDNSDWWDSDPNKSKELNEFEIETFDTPNDSYVGEQDVNVTGDTRASYTNDDGEKVPLNRTISMAFQNRGHSIATQCAKSEGGSGCVKKMGSGWKVISNKTGKPWDANYDSEASANAALKAYHAG